MALDNVFVKARAFGLYIGSLDIGYRVMIRFIGASTRYQETSMYDKDAGPSRSGYQTNRQSRKAFFLFVFTVYKQLVQLLCCPIQ